MSAESKAMVSLVAAMLADPEASAMLRSGLGLDEGTVPAAGRAVFTVASLAAEVGRTPRAIRAAIARGELPAVKRAGAYVIGADAVADWSAPEPRRERSQRASRAGAAAGGGAMARGLAASVGPPRQHRGGKGLRAVPAAGVGDASEEDLG